MTARLDRRTFLAGVLGTAGVVGLGGCSGGEGTGGPAGDTGGRPTVRMAGGPVGFPSPFAYTSGLGYYQMSLLYDTLLWKDSTGALLPWLASGYQPSDDGTTYTFTLREGLTFSDGRPLTADDVAFTFDYYARQTLPPLVIAQPRGVAEVRAIDDRTVQLQLEGPVVTFPDFVAAAVPIVPRHVWEPIEDPAAATDPELLVGSGAYRLDSFGGPDRPMAYTARDGYFLGNPFVGRIEMIPVGDALAALQAGDIDAGGNMSLGGTRPAVIEPFRSNPAFGVVDQPADAVYPLYFNLARGGALADPRFRQACARAINRQGLVERLTGGNGQPGNPGFLPPDHPYHAEVEQYSHDVNAANAALDAAGYPRSGSDGMRAGQDGAPLSFQLLTGGPLTPAAQLVADDLGRAGVQVTPRAMPLGPQLFGPKMMGEFDLAILPYPGPGGTPPVSDPDQLRMVYSSMLPPTPTGAAGYANERFDQLAQLQLVTSDEAQRRELVAEMQRIVATDLPLLPLYYSTAHYIFRRGAFDQWYYTPGGFPVGVVNKQAFITGKKTGREIRQPN